MKYMKEHQYVLIDSENNELVLVGIDLLLTRLKIDSPEYFVGPETKNPNSIQRIKNAVSFIKRNEYRQDYFEPALLNVESGKIGVLDGRHRIVAAKKMGYTHLYIEVPRDLKKLFIGLI